MASPPPLEQMKQLLQSSELDDLRIFLAWRINTLERNADVAELDRLSQLAEVEEVGRMLAAEAKAVKLARDATELKALSELTSVPDIKDLLEKRAAELAAEVMEAKAAVALDRAAQASTSVVGVAPPKAATMASSKPVASSSAPCTGPSTVSPTQVLRGRAHGAPQQPELDTTQWAEAPPPPHGFWRPEPSAVASRLVPRAAAGSTLARALVAARLPVVLTGSGLADSATRKWTFDYLEAQLGELPCTVFRSDTRSFRYWDSAKAYGEPFEPDTCRLQMTAREFAELMRASASKRDGDGSEVADGPRYYLQTGLVEGVGEAMVHDFRSFKWGWMHSETARCGWGELSSNLLLVGERFNSTPAHYDEQQNFFAQLVGQKRVVLFSPDDFGCLYPFPVHHPNDRQTMVDLYAPDSFKFPRFSQARPFETTLEPGDVLYIPQYWWHHVENLSHGCVSLNFWFK